MNNIVGQHQNTAATFEFLSAQNGNAMVKVVKKYEGPRHTLRPLVSLPDSAYVAGTTLSCALIEDD